MLPLLDDRLLRPAALSCWALVEITQAKPSLLFPTNMPHKLKPVMRPLADDHLLRPAALSCCALVETTEAKPSLLLLTNMAHKLRPVMRPLACGHVLRPVALSCCALVETTEANPSLVLFTETWCWMWGDKSWVETKVLLKVFANFFLKLTSGVPMDPTAFFYPYLLFCRPGCLGLSMKNRVKYGFCEVIN